MNDSVLAPSPRRQVKRHKERGLYQREAIYRILDEGLVCHVGIVAESQPLVLPMAYARDGDRLLLHGAAVSRLMTTLAEGVPAYVTVTLLDGLVLARSTFSHSMNYCSVMVLGRARAIVQPDDKARALERLVEHLIPGRSRDARTANRKELAAK